MQDAKFNLTFKLGIDELKFQFNHRRNLVEFVGIGLMSVFLDATTIAFLREKLRKAEVLEKLFELFEAYLRSHGLQVRSGQIIDATLLPLPKKRNTRVEIVEIKSGRLPVGWYESLNRLCRMNLDARRFK